MVLAAWEGGDGVAVGEGKHGELGADEPLLDEERGAGIAKDLLDEDVLDTVLSLLVGLGEEDTLACSETGSLEDDLLCAAELLDVGEALVDLRSVKGLEGGGGDVVLVHESLCKGLGALHLCSDGRGAKDGDADLAESEFDAIDEGLFGAGEAEVDLVLNGPGGDVAKVARGLGRVDVGASRAEGGGAPLPGAQKTCSTRLERRKWFAMACSRPPEPRMRTRREPGRGAWTRAGC